MGYPNSCVKVEVDVEVEVEVELLEVGELADGLGERGELVVPGVEHLEVAQEADLVGELGDLRCHVVRVVWREVRGGVT